MPYVPITNGKARGKIKLLTPLLLLLMMIYPAPAQGEDAIYNTLMTNYIAMSWADFAVTYYGMSKGCTETNPIARLYIDKPALAITFIALDNLIIGYASRELYKRNKAVAIGLMALVTIAKGYILYRNLQEWR